MTTVTKDYDPIMTMPPERTVRGSRGAIEAYIAEDIEWAETLCKGDVPGRVTVNTNADKTVYFLVWHMDDGSVQTDTFTITEEQP